MCDEQNFVRAAAVGCITVPSGTGKNGNPGLGADESSPNAAAFILSDRDRQNPWIERRRVARAKSTHRRLTSPSVTPIWKTGTSALTLQQVLGLGSYQTAWTWLHKLRRAMVRPGRDRLAGDVEVDETYVGGLEDGLSGRGAQKKALIVVACTISCNPKARVHCVSASHVRIPKRGESCPGGAG